MRRSARQTQPPPTVPTHSNSSSSASSIRAERNTRSHQKQPSQQKSATPQSLSSDDVGDPRANQSEPPQPRRSKRGQDNEDGDTANPDDEIDEDNGDEEEITRCVCGHQEYPGPPDTGSHRHAKNSHSASSVGASDPHADEAGGLFIQCDTCKVWQHGGCVGIMDEATSPEEYFCEECRRELHQLKTSPSGQKYSWYLPVHEQLAKLLARKSSVTKESENKSSRDKEKASRGSVEAMTKRRSTMNSRAAYDEDEVLRKVIEESKSDGGAATTNNGSRKKRARDESEDIKPESKRQRTRSGSPSSPPDSRIPSPVDSHNEAQSTKKPSSGTQKPRGAAARSQREKEQREKEQREQRDRQREEAAKGRKGRAERRRGEQDPDPSDDTAKPSPTTTQPAEPSKSQTAPDTPDIPPTTSTSHKKKPALKGRKLGRNQHTHDRDAPTPSHDASPRRNANAHSNGNSKEYSSSSPSGRGAATETNGHGSGGDSGAGGGNKGGKKGRAGAERLSMVEMKRRASAMLEYIGRTQVEMAGERSMAVRKIIEEMGVGVGGREVVVGVERKRIEVVSGEFRGLTTVQMMDWLTRELVIWQKEFGEK